MNNRHFGKHVFKAHDAQYLTKYHPDILIVFISVQFERELKLFVVSETAGDTRWSFLVQMFTDMLISAILEIVFKFYWHAPVQLTLHLMKWVHSGFLLNLYIHTFIGSRLKKRFICFVFYGFSAQSLYVALNFILKHYLCHKMRYMHFCVVMTIQGKSNMAIKAASRAVNSL